MSEPQKKKRIEISKEFDATDRIEIAQKVIEQIIKRTNDNKDINGVAFKPYSESYVNSLEFKIAGKSKNDVNLQLSGDMLNSIQIIEHGPGYIIIGYNEGTPENDKAHWNEATDKPVRRLFLGVQPSELELIQAEVKTNRPTTVAGLAKREMLVKDLMSTKDKQSALIQTILNKYYGIDVNE